MVGFFNKTYIKPKEKTLEEVQAEVDALTHVEFMKRLAGYLSMAATHGVSPYYIGGIVTPNGMMYRAFCNRLAKINGDVETANAFRNEFERRDAEMKRDAEDVVRAMPADGKVQTLWIDHEGYTQALQEVSTTRALITTYPVSGCVPLRTLTPEEMQALASQEL